MKLFFLVFSILFIISCAEDINIPPICQHRSSEVVTNIEDSIQYRIVNFITPDSNQLTSLWFELGIMNDSFYLHDRLPETYLLKIFDSDGILLIKKNDYEFDLNCEAYLLWDGFTDGKFFEGEIFYELNLGFEDDEYFNLKATCLAVSCEDFINCHNVWGDNCQYQYCISFLDFKCHLGFDRDPVNFCQ